MANGISGPAIGPQAGQGGIEQILQNQMGGGQPQGQGNRLQGIATGLQAMGAGIQGSLPQFQQQQQQQQLMQRQQEEQRRQREIQRMQTVYQDAQAAKELADQGNYEGVANLGMQRVQLLKTAFPEANPEDTQRLTLLARAASNGSDEAADLLNKELDNTVETGRALGILETPEAERISASELTDSGQVVEQTPEGELRARNVEGLRREEEPKRRSRVAVKMPGGGTKSLETDNFGNYFDLQGNPVELPTDAKIIEGSAITGTPDELGLNQSQRSRLNDVEISTRNFIDTTRDAIGMLQENPDINTFTARAASVVNSLQQEAKAMARATGKEFDENILDPSTHAETFDQMGIENQRMRSMINSLAFQAAAAAGQTGRSVSDRDVQRFITQIGADTADPRALAQTLRDVAERTQRNYQNTYEVLTGEPFEGDLGVQTLGGVDQGGDVPAIQSQEDYDRLPQGAEYMYDSERYVKGGQ